MVRSGGNLWLTSKWWGGKEVCPGDGEVTKLLISFKAIRSCEFPSSLFWQGSDGLDPVHISALLGIPTGITCVSFFSCGVCAGLPATQMMTLVKRRLRAMTQSRSFRTSSTRRRLCPTSAAGRGRCGRSWGRSGKSACSEVFRITDCDCDCASSLGRFSV